MERKLSLIIQKDISGNSWLIKQALLAYYCVMFENVNPFDDDIDCEREGFSFLSLDIPQKFSKGGITGTLGNHFVDY